MPKKRKSRSIVIAGRLVLVIGDTVFSRKNANHFFYRVDKILPNRDVILTAWGFEDDPKRKTDLDCFTISFCNLEELLTHDCHESANHRRKNLKL